MIPYFIINVNTLFQPMQTNCNLNTTIQIYQDGQLLCQTENTLTNIGKGLIHKLLTSTMSINKLALSYLTSVQTTDTTMYSDAIITDIDNSYSTLSGGNIVINFETEVSGLSAGQINRLGLAVGSDFLVTTANTGGISISNTPLFILYQIRLAITQG